MKSLSTLLVLGLLVTFAAFAQADPVSAEFLKNPWVLYGLMIAGSLVSLLKQWGAAAMDGSTATLGGLLAHWQETLTTLFGNTIAFFMLIDSGNLNFVSAISIGYAINSLADLNPVGSRSTALLDLQK
jgi:hypothetical protein